MSAKENPCKKFQANIFNKSKCQNCFKPRESHLLSDEDLNQAKPIYGGWLLLAPEGTDFDNPMHRSRKWQRRFFILYEHGLLRYALDEMPTTLPQGTINMNQCTDVIDGESRTGQKFSLCILTPEEHFIRAENKEIINGWLEMLVVYPKTNKQNQKKKRKVEPPTPQEPGPAKMAATSTGIPCAEKIPATKSTLWQEEAKGKDGQDSSSNGSPLQSPLQMPSSPSEPMPDSKIEGGMVNGDRVDGGRKTRVESGYFSLEKTKDLKNEEQPLQTPPSPSTPDTPSRRSLVIEKFEALDIEKAEHMETSCAAAPSTEARQGRSERRTFPRKREDTGVTSVPDVSASLMSPYRRAKSLDRRSTESSMTPDLLNFKKGWLTKQYPDGQWKKHWFVLTDQNLRYYRDSVAEEAADLDGEIDLSTCYDVTEYPVQRNYGFQIHTKEGGYTLSAMTSGIRRNWIQTIMKHVRPNTAPDVTSSLPEEKSKTTSSFVSSSVPSDKQDSEHSDADGEQKRSRARERRREGRSKTFDWAEFRPIQQALAQERAQAAEAMKSTSCYDTTDSKGDLGEVERERARRREERRKRFENSDSVEESAGEDTSHMEIDKGPASSDSIDIRPNVQVEIEQRWQQVETTPLREEKQIPIAPLPVPSASPKHPAEDFSILLDKQLEQSRKEVSDLLAENLLLQQRLKEALEQQHNARDGYVLQTELAEPSLDAWQRIHKVNEDLQNELEAHCRRQEMFSHQIQSLKHSYAEAKDCIRHHEAEILSLQGRLNSTSAELAMREQALAKLKEDLRLEKEKSNEMLEEWKSSEAALCFQLKASQQKLKEVESLLLEKSQEIREFETEQALQKDYQKEVVRLQDKLASLQSQLNASEQAQLVTEERLQMNYEELLRSYEKEKQLLIFNLKEVEERLVEYEDKMQEKDQSMEVLQKEKLNANTETSIFVHHLEEQLSGKDSTIQRLEECVKALELKRDQLSSTCQEMANQIAVSDTDITRLQTRLDIRESEYRELKRLLEESSAELLKVQESLTAKEKELKEVCGAHRKVVEKKDQDINEALIKMAALGGSLEETETKLKSKEEALSLCSLSTESQIKEFEAIYVQLESAKRRIVELEQSLQFGGRDVFSEVLRGDGVMESQSPSSLVNVNLAACSEKEQDTGTKRQRIRFSSIQCQRYAHVDSSEKTWASPETSQGRSVSPEITTQPSGRNDPESCLSIIQSLESKLCLTEEKLKDVTVNLENERSGHEETLHGLHKQWAVKEASLREQLQSNITQINSMAKQIEEEQRAKLEAISRHPERTTEEMIYCLESCRNALKELQAIGTTQINFTMFSDIHTALINTAQSLQKALKSESLDVGCSDIARCQQQPQSTEAVQLQDPRNPVQTLSEKIHFQANLLYRMAEALKCTAEEEEHSGEGPSEVSLIEMLTRRVRLERDFWDRVEQLGRAIAANIGGELGESELNPHCHPDLLQIMADRTLLKAELSSVRQKAKTYYELWSTVKAETQNSKAIAEGQCTDVGETRYPVPHELEHHGLSLFEQYSDTDISFQEELSHRLKENAVELKSLSSTLMSIPHAEFPDAVQSLLQTTRELSGCLQSHGPGSFPPLLIQESIVQAQLCYIACKTRLECESEAKQRRDTMCLAHAEALAKLHEEYQDLLRMKETELSEVLEREKTVAEAAAVQAEDAERFIGEMEAKFKENVSHLDSRYKEELHNLMERWAEREDALKAELVDVEVKLQASERTMQKVENDHRDQITHLESLFQEQIEELRKLHRNEIMTLENRYTQSIHQLQDTLDSYQREHSWTSSPGDPAPHSIGTDQSLAAGDADSMNVLKGRIVELEAQMDMMREELEQRNPEGNMSSIKKKYQADFENLKVLSDYIDVFSVTSFCYAAFSNRRGDVLQF